MPAIRKFSSINKEWINNLPKYINENGCWIPSNIEPNNTGYIQIKSEQQKYLLHRLVVSIYHNLDYSNQRWDTRHSKGCDKRCFWIEHLQPGTSGDNNRDTVKHGTNYQTKKECCSKCGGPYRKHIVKSGWNRGKVQRVCDNCVYLRDQGKKLRRSK